MTARETLQAIYHENFLADYQDACIEMNRG